MLGGRRPRIHWKDMDQAFPRVTRVTISFISVWLNVPSSTADYLHDIRIVDSEGTKHFISPTVIWYSRLSRKKFDLAADCPVRAVVPGGVMVWNDDTDTDQANGDKTMREGEEWKKKSAPNPTRQNMWVSLVAWRSILVLARTLIFHFRYAYSQ